METLCSSKHVFVDTPSSTSLPHPSKHAYAVVLALRVLASTQGWAWTNDTLIQHHLWPLLEQWNKSPSSLREATIICIIRLIGELWEGVLGREGGRVKCTDEAGS